MYLKHVFSVLAWGGVHVFQNFTMAFSGPVLAQAALCSLERFIKGLLEGFGPKTSPRSCVHVSL